MSGVGGRAKMVSGARGSGMREWSRAARGMIAGVGMLAGAGRGARGFSELTSVTAERSVLPSADW
jgi:hypothetical protein